MDRAAMDELAAFLACAPEAGVFDLLYLRAAALAEAQARAAGKAAPERAGRAVLAVIAADRLRVLAALARARRGRAPGRFLAALEAQAAACAVEAVGLMAPGLQVRSVRGVAAYGRAWVGVLGCRGRVALWRVWSYMRIASG